VTVTSYARTRPCLNTEVCHADASMLTASVGPSEASRLSRVTSAPASGAGESGAAVGDYISRRAAAAMRARELMAIRAESARLHSRSGSDVLGPGGTMGTVADASPRRHSATATLVAGRSAHPANSAAGGIAGSRKPRPLTASQKNAARCV
jgi:hypothetical protein